MNGVASMLMNFAKPCWFFLFHDFQLSSSHLQQLQSHSAERCHPQKRWIIYNWLLLYVSGLKSLLISGSHCAERIKEGGNGAKEGRRSRAGLIRFSPHSVEKKSLLSFRHWPDFHCHCTLHIPAHSFACYVSAMFIFYPSDLSLNP